MSHPKDPFNNENLNMPDEDFELAMKLMLEKGLVTSFVKDGEVYYKLTDTGFAIGNHLVSDPSMAN